MTRSPARLSSRRWRVALCLLGLGGPGAHATAATLQPIEPARTADASGTVDVWVDLSEPSLATAAHASDEQRADLGQRIARQQDAVMAALRPLGGVEQARVRIVRNALAVRLPPESLAAARQVPGVAGVHPVRHLRTNGAPSESSPSD